MDKISIDKVKNYIYKNWENCLFDGEVDEKEIYPLPYPFSTPSMNGFFCKTQFYWDTYFINIGLIKSNESEQALKNVENMLYQVEKFGHVGNDNSHIGMKRSQPPLLSEAVLDLYKTYGDKKWLERAYSILEKEYSFWQTERMTPTGLNRYYHSSDYDYLIVFGEYMLERLKLERPDNLIDMAKNYLAEAESGWDFCCRYNGKGADYIPIDLNSILYKFESNMLYFSKELNTKTEALWENRRNKRKELMYKYCFNSKTGCFYDYNYKTNTLSDVISVAMLYPLWANIDVEKNSQSIIKTVFDALYYPHGIAACQNKGERPLQWEFPNAWPPLHFFAIEALLNSKQEEKAKELASKYINATVNNFEKTGGLWEKYNCVTGTLDVTDEYEMPTMMGWSASVFLYCCDIIAAV